MSIAALAAHGPIPYAYADTDTDSFDVTAKVLASCDVTAGDLAFGNYNPVTASNLDGASTISLICTSGTTYNVGLSLGDGSGASVGTRYMTNGANKLGYTLYQNTGRTTQWGSTIGANTLAGTGTGSAVNIDVFGRIPMQQAVPAGDYTDTIVVTVTW